MYFLEFLKELGHLLEYCHYVHFTRIQGPSKTIREDLLRMVSMEQIQDSIPEQKQNIWLDCFHYYFELATSYQNISKKSEDQDS